MGIKTYMNPEILDMVEEMSDEHELMELIDNFNMLGEEDRWDGSPGQFRRDLSGVLPLGARAMANKYLVSDNQAGKVLRELSRKSNRVEYHKTNKGATYTIWRTGLPK